MKSLVYIALALLWGGVALAQTVPTSQPSDRGPDVVILRDLVSTYEPVPFDHKGHARMAEMWDGCTTCHHRTPAATTKPATTLHGVKTQAAAGTVPQCKSCHEISAKDVDLRMPNLKGALHRQCLNCHREWAHANGCSACHKQRDTRIAAATTPAPSVDDIVGRMHPPIPEPNEKLYKARFIPAVGVNVLFRHKEHSEAFGIRCVQCHRKDNCAHCHEGKKVTTTPVAELPVHPGRTWKDSHGPCISCHKADNCRHCHFDEKAKAPAAFAHQTTGQMLDADHAKLKCGQCHANYKSTVAMSCGTANCHKRSGVAFPKDRPGPVVTTRPAVVQIAAAAPAATQPTTRAVIKRIRR